MTDRYEDNDSLLTASSLGLLTGFGTIANLSIDDEDWFQLTTSAPGTVDSWIQLDFLHAEGDVDIFLYDASGNLISNSSGVSNTEQISFNGRDAGTYYLRVFGYNGATNPNYALTFNLPGSSREDGYEENDASISATDLGTLTSPALLTGLSLQDEDWFQFTLAAVGNYNSTIHLDFLHANGDIDVRLFDAVGNLVGSSTGVGNSETLSLAGLAAGTYYLRIYGYAGATNAYYDLSITPPGIQSDLYEDNDTQGTASLLGTLTAPLAIANLSINDEDWFQFTTTTTGTTGDTIQLNFAHANGDIDLQLLDASGNLLTGSYGVSDGELISLAGLAAGTYYARVYGYAGALNPNYTLTINPPSSAEDPYEENDSQAEVLDPDADANLGTLLYATTLSGLSLTDADWFQFTTAGPGTFDSVVQLDFLHASGDIDVQLVNANGTPIRGSYGVGDREAISLDGLAAGTYFLHIYGYNGATNPYYNLSILPPPNPVPSPDSFEPNNTLATAVDLRLLSGSGNQVNNLTIHGSEDEDWFRFEIAADGTASHEARIAFNGELGDVDVELYDADGAWLDGSYGVGNLESVSLDRLIAGTYYLRVYGYASATSPDYDLTIDAPDAPPTSIAEDVAEENDSLAQAYDLRYQGGYYDTSNLPLTMDDSANEVLPRDWFKLTLPAAGLAGDRVFIQFDHALGDLDMSLHDSTGAVIGRSQGIVNEESISLANLAAGDYYVQVYGYAGARNPSYTLAVDGPTPSSAIQPDSLESNNSFNTATDLRQLTGTGNSWEDLTIAPSDDRDWFKFTTVGAGRANDFVQITFSHAAGNLALALFDQSGTLISQSNGTTGTERVSLQGLAAGTYYARVTGVQGATSPNYSLTVNAPSDNTAPLPEWTVLVYVDADNNLESFGLEDLNEMEAVALPNNVRVVTMIDRIPGYDTSNGNWTDTRRGVMTHDADLGVVSSPLASIGEQNMGSPQTLTNFIEWGVQNNPAQHYALVLWNHGGGLSGVTWDDSSNGDNLTLQEVSQAIAASDVDFDLVGFDACLQGMVEQGYELRNLTDVMVASQQLEPGDGWDYTGWLSQLAANPAMNAAQLGSAIVSSYGEFYGNQETLSATRVGNYAGLKNALRNFVTTVINTATTADWRAIAEARNAAPFFALPEYRDLKSFTDRIASTNSITDAIQTAAQAVSTAVTNALIRNHSGAQEAGTGLSIYLPEFGDVDYSAGLADFYTDTGWLNFLNQRAGSTSGRVRTSDPDWAEANDVRSQARDLHQLAGPGKLFTNLNIGDSSDIDWFRFETVGVGTSSDAAQIVFKTTNGRLKLQAYDADGALLRTSTSIPSGTNTIERISLSGLAAGQYFLKVSGVSGTMNTYTLRINAPASNTILDDWAERNDSMEQAYDLGAVGVEEIRFPGLTMDGSAGEGSRGDWFMVTANRGTEWNPNQIALQFDNSQGNLDLFLYDGQGRAINPSQGVTNGNGETVSLNDVSGRIYIRVKGRNSTTTNPDYTIVFRGDQALPNSVPTIQSSAFTLPENRANHTVVGTIQATDPEGDPLTYTITSGNRDVDRDGVAAFAINQDNGRLRVLDRDDLDYEAVPSFNLTVQVEDEGGQQNAKRIVVNLTDVLGETVTGTPDDDTLLGDAGNNVITGGFGNDVITTGAGRDRVVFRTNRPFDAEIGVDRIQDFNSLLDKVVLDKTTFTEMTGQTISFATVSSTAAAAANRALFTYVRNTGSLYYNANRTAGGFGSGGLFADFTNEPILTVNSFLVQA